MALENIITSSFPLLLPHIRTIRLVQVQPDEPNTNPAPSAVPATALLRSTRSRSPVSLRDGAPEPVSHPQDAAVHVFAHGQQRGKRLLSLCLSISMQPSSGKRFYYTPSAGSSSHHISSLQNMSPASGTGMSPSYPHSEPSPDQMGSYNTVIIGSRMAQRPPSSSPPLTPNPQPTISSASMCMKNREGVGRTGLLTRLLVPPQTDLPP